VKPKFIATPRQVTCRHSWLFRGSEPALAPPDEALQPFDRVLAAQNAR